MRVWAPAAFRYPALVGQDYPYGLQDITSDSLARALLAAGLVQDASGAPGGGLAAQSGVAKYVTLSGNYTLGPGDDNTFFSAPESTAYVVSILAATTPPPACVFLPPDTGSITLHMPDGASLNGSTTDVVVNISTFPAGAGLVPRPSRPGKYGLTVNQSQWGSLAGVPTDSAALVALLANYAKAAPGGNKQGGGGYTLQATDSGGFVWLAAQATDQVFSFPRALAGATPWWVVIGYLNASAAAGRLQLAATGGGTFNWTNSQATGALQTASPIFMGSAGSNNLAAALVLSEGSQPGGAFVVYPLCGAFSLT